jgi:hypothetical protein
MPGQTGRMLNGSGEARAVNRAARPRRGALDKAKLRFSKIGLRNKYQMTDQIKAKPWKS